MPFYQQFTRNGATMPDLTALAASIRTAVGDATAGVALLDPTVVMVKKATAFTAPQISAAQAAVDAAPVMTAQIAAQREIDNFPIAYKALVLALIDQINVIRAALPTPLSAVTPAQALTAIRNKAGTL